MKDLAVTGAGPATKDEDALGILHQCPTRFAVTAAQMSHMSISTKYRIGHGLEHQRTTGAPLNRLRTVSPLISSFLLVTLVLGQSPIAWAAGSVAREAPQAAALAPDNAAVDVARAPSHPTGADADPEEASDPHDRADDVRRTAPDLVDAANSVDPAQHDDAKKALAAAAEAARDTAALPSGADKSGVTSTSISVPQGSGKIEGMGESFSTQLSTGVATFNVPFALLKARGSAQPNLGLAYSSGSGAGLAGMGWDVGVPFIARQTDRSTPKYDDRGDFHPEQDRFVFNGGQELVPVCTVQSGAGRPCVGAYQHESFPYWSVGWQYFRARVEGSFLRFFWHPNGQTWRVQDKSGVNMEFGVATDDATYRGALEANPDEPAQIYKWHLVRQYDGHGLANADTIANPYNSVVYRHRQDGGTVYVSDIYDTTPVSDPRTKDLAKYAHHVRLRYEARTDPSFSYRAGWRIARRLRLKGVDVSSKTYGGATAARRQVRRYHLRYDPAAHVSLLAGVQVEGRCANREAEAPAEDDLFRLPSDTNEAATTTCQRLPEMVFQYTRADAQQGPQALPGYEPFDGRVRPLNDSPPHSLDEALTDLFDVNADGLPDVLVTAPALFDGGHGVFFNGGLGRADTYAAPQSMTVLGALNSDSEAVKLSNLNITPLDLDGDATVDLLHMPRTKSYAIYSPRKSAGKWAWVGRNIETASTLDPKIDFGKDASDIQVLDANFDGLVDVVVSTGTELQTFFALGRYPGGDGQFGKATWTGPESASLSNDPVRACVPWSGQPVRFSDPDIKVSDINGDGIPDIVRLRRGSIIYWPGRGNGVWGTGDPASCLTGGFASDRHITMAGSPYYSDLQADTLRLDDVNGDGLPDLVQINFDSITTWLNVDGVSWTAASRITGTPASPSFLNRVRLVDVNGSGTPDVLWGNAGAYKYIDLHGGSRPYLLTRIENGLGKSSTIEYGTSSAEMLSAERGGACDPQSVPADPWTVGWCSKMPTVVHVVKRVTDSDNLDRAGAGRAAGKYVTEYSYRDPVYEGRQREFRGFRYARVKKLGDSNSPTDVSESQFLLGECVDENPAPEIDTCSPAYRWKDNSSEALKGLPVIEERFNEQREYLTTEHKLYRLRRICQGRDGRGVWHAFANTANTYQYETQPFTYQTAAMPTSFVMREPGIDGSSYTLDSVTHLIRNSRGYRATRVEQRYDYYGNNTSTLNRGCVRGSAGACDSPEVYETVRAFWIPAGEPGYWGWREIDTYVRGNRHTELYKRTKSEYSPQLDLVKTKIVVAGTLPLDRSDKNGNPVAAATAAPPPLSTVDGEHTVSEMAYDALGTPQTVQQLAVGRCRDMVADSEYGVFVVEERIWAGPTVSGQCGTKKLSSSATYDAGLQVSALTIDLNGQITSGTYDGFGRLTQLRRPPPTGSFDANGNAIAVPPSSIIEYTIGNPVSVIHTRTQDGKLHGDEQYLESKTYVDGMGRSLVQLGESESPGGWIASGFTEYDGKGAPYRKYCAYSLAPGADPLRVSAHNIGYGSTSYDAFGRELVTRDCGDVITLKKTHNLSSTKLEDAEDQNVGGVHHGTYVVEHYDSHGRVSRVSEHVRVNGVPEVRHVVTTYLPTNLVETITRERVNSPSVVRWMRYDTQGRMVLNVEPSSTKDFSPSSATDPNAMRAWRYAYNTAGDLVGTSDARGCGLNFIYDSVGRLNVEDYWPCSPDHADYSPVSLAAQTGIEVLYAYDDLPASAGGVVSPPRSGVAMNDPDYQPAPPVGADEQHADRKASFYQGKLVAIIDRAASSWPSYDARGRVVQTSLRLARPDAPANGFVGRFAPRWYYQNVVYDAADREILATTGAKSSELTSTLVAGTSARGHDRSIVSTLYNSRGAIASVEGSYGSLVSSITRDPDGSVRTIEYGDAANTYSVFSYDSRRRLIGMATERPLSAAWSNPAAYSPSPNYNPETPSVYQTILQDDDYELDLVGNPVRIVDNRPADQWPSGARPVTRVVQYDNAYRATQVDYQYGSGEDGWISPYDADFSPDPSLQDPRRGRPLPAQTFDKRVKTQAFEYDWLGNTSRTTDDAHGFYDRSLGTITNNHAGNKPYQLQSATNEATGSVRSGRLAATFDHAGNTISLSVIRNGPCQGGSCSQQFAYTYDEVNRLVRARRWDTSGVPAGTPTIDLKYTYDGNDQRRLKSATSATSATSVHTAYIFAGLELRRAQWDGTDYVRTKWTEVPYLQARGVRLAQVHWHEGPGGAISLPGPNGSKQHVLLQVADYLGSTSITIDKATGELVERSTYQAYGAAETTYRPARWQGFRSDYRYTGKEEDVEVGLTYFGKRFYSPYLGRWMNPDPLAVHTPGEADLNVYAYVQGRVLQAIDPLGLEDESVANPPTRGVANSTPAAVSNGGANIEFAPDILLSGDPPAGTPAATPMPFGRSGGALPAGPSFADQRVQQMGHAAYDSALEMVEGPLRLAAAASNWVGLESLGGLYNGAADMIGADKYGPPSDPVLNLSYEEHRFGSGLFYSGITLVVPIKLGGMRPGTNDFEFSLMSLGNKATYEVGQLTLRQSSYDALRAADMVGETAEEVLARGRMFLEQWGVLGTMARLGPSNLRKTLPTQATPAAQALKQTVVPGAQAGAITGRQTVDSSDAD